MPILQCGPINVLRSAASRRRQVEIMPADLTRAEASNSSFGFAMRNAVFRQIHIHIRADYGRLLGFALVRRQSAGQRGSGRRQCMWRIRASVGYLWREHCPATGGIVVVYMLLCNVKTCSARSLSFAESCAGEFVSSVFSLNSSRFVCRRRSCLLFAWPWTIAPV